MAYRIVKQVASIGAGATVSLNTDVDFAAVRTSTNGRIVRSIGIAGATVNTGILKVLVANEAIFSVANGVTNTTGAPIKGDDAVDVMEAVEASETLDFQVYNSSGGALQFYVYAELEDV